MPNSKKKKKKEKKKEKKQKRVNFPVYAIPFRCFLVVTGILGLLSHSAMILDLGSSIIKKKKKKPKAFFFPYIGLCIPFDSSRFGKRYNGQMGA